MIVAPIQINHIYVFFFFDVKIITLYKVSMRLMCIALDNV